MRPKARSQNRTLVLSADSTHSGPNTYTLMNPTGYPFGFWMYNSSISKWIAPESDYDSNAVGNYTYRTTFDLPNKFNSKKDTASITGVWSSDNTGLDILINGVSTGNFIPFGGGNPPTDPWSFQVFTPFSITTGFEKGLNTLDFVVFNKEDITGLRVEMTGAYDLKPIPEPSSALLVGIGLVGLIGYGWKGWLGSVHLPPQTKSDKRSGKL